MRASLHPSGFVRVRVPAYLERSLQLAIGAVHAPFFTVREADALVVILQDVEWARLAARFPSATAERGLRLISIDEPPSDPAFSRRLAETLGAAGLQASTFPAFHRDHLIVPEEYAQRCLDAVLALIAAT